MNRTGLSQRKTRETDISIQIELETEAPSNIVTPIPFFTHMLELFARHGNFKMDCKIEGDIEVDYHHTVEDSGIVLGSAFKDAILDKKGINRYGFFLLPMDETLVSVALDLSGRPYFQYDIGDICGKIGDFDIEYTKHFFRSFAHQLQMNLHIKRHYGDDKHHVIEAIFKATARSLKEAVKISGTEIPSTKEVL